MYNYYITIHLTTFGFPNRWLMIVLPHRPGAAPCRDCPRMIKRCVVRATSRAPPVLHEAPAMAQSRAKMWIKLWQNVGFTSKKCSDHFFKRWLSQQHVDWTIRTYDLSKETVELTLGTCDFSMKTCHFTINNGGWEPIKKVILSAG